MSKPIDRARIQEEIDAYFDEILQELRNLEWAMAEIGDDFDEAEWIACFESGEPAEQARRSQVLWPFSNAFNCLNEVLRRASWITQGQETTEDMKAVLTTLRQDGGIRSSTEKTLKRLNRDGRNAVTHGYPGTDPAALRLAILDFVGVQPALRGELDAWLVKRGYRLMPQP